jgi:hypothetical protein
MKVATRHAMRHAGRHTRTATAAGREIWSGKRIFLAKVGATTSFLKQGEARLWLNRTHRVHRLAQY